MKLNIKSNILKIATFMLPAIALWSCNEDLDPGFNNEEISDYYIVLSTGLNSTRAVTDFSAEKELEIENNINRYSIFFYKNDYSENDEPLFVVDRNINKTTEDVKVVVSLPVSIVNELFGPEGTSCSAIALVNLPSDITVDATNKTITYDDNVLAGDDDDIIDNPGVNYKTVIATKTNINKVRISKNMGGTDFIPESMVMRGESSSLELKRDENKITGKIDLKRIASKIRLWVNIPEKVYIDNKNRAFTEREIDELKKTFEQSSDKNNYEGFDEWFLKTENLNIGSGRKGGQICTSSRSEKAHRLYMNNGVRTAHLDGDPMENGKRWLTADDYYSLKRSDTNNDNDRYLIQYENQEQWSDGNIYNFTHARALYSYPNTWDNADLEERQSYLVLMVAWKIEDENTYGKIQAFTDCFYQVPINSASSSASEEEKNCIKSNSYYRIALKVGMLGSFSFGDPQEIDGVYWQVLDWNTVDLDMKLQEAKYLVFNQDNFVLNNEQQLEIPFTASHEVEVKACYVTYFNFNDAWGTDAANNRNEFSVRTGNANS